MSPGAILRSAALVAALAFPALVGPGAAAASAAAAPPAAAAGESGVRSPEDPAAGPAPEPAAGRRALALDDIDSELPWLVRRVRIEGLGRLRAWWLSSSLATRARPWWAIWREPGRFHPAFLRQDVERLREALEADGYYDAKVTARVDVLREPGGTAAPEMVVRLPQVRIPLLSAPEESPRDEPLDRVTSPGVVAVRIEVEPGEPSRVCSLFVDLGPGVASGDADRLRRSATLRVGDVFTRAEYRQSAAAIEAYHAERGHPRPVVHREAVVDAARHCVAVSLRADPGPAAVFGPTTVETVPGLPESLAAREIAWDEGEPYDARLVRETERRLRGLRVFSLARVDTGTGADGRVPMRITVAPAETREIRLGVGVSSEEGFRGLASWWDYNAFGGARQLGVTARVSQINRVIGASFVQPHFPGMRNRTSTTLALGQDHEQTYDDQYSRIVGQVDWRARRDVLGTAFVRGSYDSLSNVTPETRAALDDYAGSGFTVSTGGTVRWTRVDDPLDPHRGFSLGATAEVAGGPVLGADFSWFRAIANLRAYQPLGGDVIGTLRVTVGSIVPYDGTLQVPLWERFYAGGTGVYPVRGYARRRVGPISGSNDPIGGRSVALASLELRRPVWGPLVGVLFVDTGDVEMSAWTIDPRHFQTGVGFGVRIATPIGPVQLDLGFGLDPPPGDSLVQVAFSIGPEL